MESGCPEGGHPLFSVHSRFRHLEYSVLCKIDPAVGFKEDPLLLQPLSLGFCAPEGISGSDLPPAVDYPVAGNAARVRVMVQDVSHRSCQVAVSQTGGKLSVSSHFSFRHRLDQCIYFFFHGSPNKGKNPVFDLLLIGCVAGKLPGQQGFFVFQPGNDNGRIESKDDQRIPGAQNQWDH